MELIQKQTQQLDQRQIQRLEVLQMSALELRDYLQEFSQENPVVDLNEPNPPAPSDREDAQLQHLRWLADNDRQNRYYQERDYDDDPIARIGVSGGLEETLPQFIGRQLDRLSIDKDTAQAVGLLAACLDGDGYLRLELDELAHDINIPQGRLEAALAVLWTLEPAGVGARNLSQCLALQLERAEVDGPALSIVRNHLEDLGRRHYRLIADRLKISMDEVLAAEKAIRELDPRPGAVFEQPGQTPYIYPDVFVEERDGRFVAHTRGDGERPAFRINSYYRALLDRSQQKEVREYLRKKVQSAQDVLQAIAQRQDTLLRCAQAIVDRQEAFFREGEQALRPLRMADVADMVGIHESTVSRAVREKYLQCQRGVYPLGWFFSRGAAGGEVGGAGARAMLRRLIDGEDKAHPLSDQKLCEELARQGCPISRRTVAKYRDELNIPGASGRKNRG